MSETPIQPQQLPNSEDFRKINALLREDVTAEVREEVANRLVLLAAREPHPRAKAAMLERAARLVTDIDTERSIVLLRESFRHSPNIEVGQRLAAAGEEDPVLHRLGRMSAIYDAIAAIAPDEETQRELLIHAAHYHLERGHGVRALKALDKLRNLGSFDETLEELQATAQAQIKTREQELRASRKRIGDANDDRRGEALLSYAQTLLAGDEPLKDASAVLADAAEAARGGDLQKTAPLWAEVARAVGEPEMLAHALAACLSTPQAEHERLRMADELVNLPGVDTHNPELVQTALETLSAAMPNDADLYARLLASRAIAGEPDANKELNKMRLDAVRAHDRATEAVVCLALAKIADHHQDPGKVERYLRRVRTLDPHNSEALDFFENQYRDRQDYRRLYLVLTHRLAISQGEDLVRIALEMARLAEGPMDTLERAIEAYGRVLTVHPNHRESLDALDRLYRTTQRWSSLRDLLDRRAINLGSHAEATPEILREGQKILEQLAKLHRPDGQLPDAEALFQTYRRLHIAAPENVEAAQALIVRYRSEEAWRPLVSVLETQLDHATESKDRTDYARELYLIYRDQLHDLARAQATLDRLADDEPTDQESLLLLAKAHAAAGRDDKLQSVRAQLVPLLQGDAQIAMLEEIAATAVERDDEAQAIGWYQQLLELVPTHIAALHALTRLYDSPEHRTELANLLHLRLRDETLEQEERITLLEQLATIETDHIKDTQSAEETATSLLAIAPDSQIAQTLLRRIMVQRAAYDELRQAESPDEAGARTYIARLEEQLDVLPSSSRAQALMAIAEAWSSELDQPLKAAQEAHKALLILLENDESERETIVTIAQGLLLYAEAAKEIDLQSMAVAVLIEHNEGELQHLYMAQRVALCEEQEDLTGAFDAMTALLATRLLEDDLDGFSRAAERLCNLAEQASSEEELPELLTSWAEMLAMETDPKHQDLAVDLWALSAHRLIVRGENPEGAMASIDQALLLKPESTNLWLLREQVCSDLGQWGEVVTSLERRAALLPEAKRVEVLLRAASLCDGAVEDPVRAEALYRKIIVERPESKNAWAGLLSQLREKEDTDEYAQAIDTYLELPEHERAELAIVSRDRVQMLIEAGAEIGQLIRTTTPILKLIATQGQTEDAEPTIIDALMGVIAHSDAPQALAKTLLPALETLKRHRDLLTCHRALTSEAKVGSDIHVGGLLNMARISQVGLLDPDRTWELLREALLAAPSHPELWKRICELADREERSETLYALLAAMSGATKTDGITAIDDKDTRIILLKRWGAYAMGRGDAQAATQALTLLHDADPSALEPLEALEALYRETENYDAVATVLQERLTRLPDDPEIEGSWLRLADLHLSDRDDARSAITCLDSAHAALPDSEAIAAMRLGVLREHGRPEALLGALSARIDTLREHKNSEDDELISLLEREAAAVQEERLGDLDGSLQRWMKLLRATPQDDEAAERCFELLLRTASERERNDAIFTELQALLTARKDHERVDALLTLRTETGEGPDLLDLLRTQARLRERDLKRPDLALDALKRALTLQPDDANIPQEIERLATLPEDAPALDAIAEAFIQAAQKARDPLRQKLRKKAATFLLAQDGGEREAIELYRVMLVDNPGDAEVLEQLDTLLRETGDERARLAVLQARGKTTDDPAQALAIGLEHARLASELNEDETAIAAWTRIAELQKPSDRAEAAMALIELHERRGELPAQARATLMLRDLAAEDDEKIGLCLQASDLFALSGDSNEALVLLRQAQEIDPMSPAVYAAIEERLRLDDESAALLIHLHEGWAQVYASDPDFAESRLAAAAGHLEQLDLRNASSASLWSTLREMLDAGLDDETLRLRLDELAIDDDDEVAKAASDRAVQDSEARDDQAAAIAARLSRLARFPEREDARQERKTVAHLLEDKLQDAEAALGQWSALLSADPRDREAVEALLRLGDATGAEDEVEASINEAVQALKEVDARNDLRMITATHMIAANRQDKALEWLDRVLTEAPKHAKAYELRGELLATRQDSDSQARQLLHHEHGVTHAIDDHNRRLARTMLASLHLEMGHADLAFETIRAEIKATEKPEERANLYQIADALADEAKLEEPLWDLLAENSDDKDLRAELMIRAAGLSEESGDAETAAAYLRMALEEREDPALRQRLRRTLTRSGAYDALAVDLETEAASKKGERSPLLEEALTLWLDKVGDPEQGLRVLDELLALHPTRLDLQDRRLDVLRLQDEAAWVIALRETIETARQAKDLQRVARLLPELIKQQGDQESPQTVYQWLLEMQRGEASAAKIASVATPLLDRIDDLPDDDALDLLAILLKGVDPSAEPDLWMMAALQRVDRLQDNKAQQELLVKLSEHARDHMRDLDLSVEWLARAHLLQTSNLERAYTLLKMADTSTRRETALPILRSSLSDETLSVDDRVKLSWALLAKAPDDEETWALIETLCNDKAFCLPAAEMLGPKLTEIEQHAHAIELQQRALLWLPASTRGEAVLRLGQQMTDDLKQPADAMQFMLDQTPEVDEPLTLINATYDLARTHDLVIDWLEGVELLIASEFFSGETASAAAELAAGVAATELDDPSRAAEMWARVWDEDPDSDDARDAVLALRRQAKDPDALAADLDRALLQTEGDEATDLRLELAELCLKQLNRPTEALHQVRAVLRDQPTHHEAMILTTALTEEPSCAMDALKLLEPIYRRTERWRELSEVLERQVALRSTIADNVTMLGIIADLQQYKLKDTKKALGTLLELLKIAPDGTLVDRAAKLAVKVNDQDAQKEIWELGLGDKLPRRDREGILASAAAWYYDQADTTKAETLWSELVTLSPAQRVAWEGLDTIYDEAGRWADLIGLLERRADVTTDPEMLRVILHRLGGIAQASDRMETALKAYKRLSSLDREDPDPATMVVELLRVMGERIELADALQSLAGRLSDREERAGLLCEAARLHLNYLHNNDMATELYHQAFELSPASDEAFVYLEKQRQANSKQLMRLYRHRAGGVSRGPSRTLVLRKLATVCGELGRHAEARAALDKALADDPENRALNDALLEICLLQGDLPGYLEAADRRLAGEMSPLNRITLLRQIVKLSVEKELDAPKYVRELSELVPDDPDLPILTAMMMARSEDPQQAAEGLERVIKQTEEADRKVPLLEKMAALYSGPLKNPHKTIASLQRILQLSPDHWQAHQELCNLYQLRGSHEAQLTCLQNWLARLPEGDPRRVPVLADLSETLLTLGKGSEARPLLEQALSIDKKNARINTALAPLLEEAGEYERALELQRWVVEHLRQTRQRDELPAAATSAGETLERLGQQEEARRMFRLALGGDPRRTDAILGLARTSLMLGDVGRAMAEFEKIAHHISGEVSSDELAEAELGLGRCWRQRGKPHQARAHLNRALALKPDLREAIQELNEV